MNLRLNEYSIFKYTLTFREESYFLKEFLKFLLVSSIAMIGSYVTYQFYTKASEMPFSIAFLGGAITLLLHEVVRNAIKSKDGIYVTGGNHVDFDYQLKIGDLKVKVTSVGTWSVKGIRSDNGIEDSFPIKYFRDNFQKIEAVN